MTPSITLPVTLANFQLQDVSQPGNPTAAYYSLTVEILGTSHHLCLFPICTDEESGEQLTTPAFADWLEGMGTIDGREAYETIRIDDCEYVAVLTPFCS